MATNEAVTNQQALVRDLLSRVPNKPIRHVIPGGKLLFTEGHEMNIKQLEQAIYTWLRRVRSFDECSLVFSKTPSKYNTKSVRVIDFPLEGGLIWNSATKGKSYLAKIMATQVAEGKLVSVTAKKDGLYVQQEHEGKLTPQSEDWEPYLEFVRTKKEEYSVY